MAAEEIEVRVLDDGSDASRIAGGVSRLACECDLLLGPYSTALMRAAGTAIAEVDGLLWNHGGSGDDVQELCPGRIVSVPAPTSRYAHPFVTARADRTPRAPLWVVRGPGRFGRQVAAGAQHEARRVGLEAVQWRADEQASWWQTVPERWDLLSAGRFEDDIEIVHQARSASSPPRAVCSIAAGVSDFASFVKEPAGIYGIAQWAPGRERPIELGPSERALVATYRRIAGTSPDYPAIQAVAAGVIAVHCARVAGAVTPAALWAAATSLDTTTVLGAFAVDPSTGAQRRHDTVLLRWGATGPQPVQ